MSSDFIVRKIDSKTAMNVIISKHYLKRKCCCIEAFGLFVEGKDDGFLFNDGILKGVIVFGKPASFTLCNGVCGPEESENVVEFNRLWVCDSMPKNTESKFVSMALKQSKYQIIVSFADIEQGHVGYIYQATNWIYTGLSPAMRYFKPKTLEAEGGVKYSRRKRMTKAEIVDKHGEDMVEEYWSSPKHRYVFFNSPKKRRKLLMKKLKYPVLPYPKHGSI